MPVVSATASLDFAAARDRYARNLAALYRNDAPLAAQIDAMPFASLPQIEPTRDGEWTVRLNADDGRPIYLHSRYAPLDEAAKLIEAQTSGEPSTLIFAGFGLGYAALAAESRFDRPTIVVAEDNLALIKTALCLCELSRPLQEFRLVFLTSADRAMIHEKLRLRAADLMLGTQFVTLPHALRHHCDFHTQVGALIRDFIDFSHLQMVTLLKNARVTCKNVLFNLSHYLQSPGIESLAGRAAGYPAIIVAAGPSLARNVRQLETLRNRAVIIGVQTVYKLLHAIGVAPHFVTSLDFHEVSAEFFRGAPQPGGCALVAEPKATWHVLDGFHGQRFVLHNYLYDWIFEGALAMHGGLKAGATVAHLALYLAQHLGCDPIIFIGQDLAFTDGLFYLPGSPIEEIWSPELGRFQTIEMKQWERIVRNRPILRRVTDIHGDPVYTDDLLFTYADQFQAEFSNSRSRIIQASEGGMRLVGAEVMSLEEAAAGFCSRTLPEGLFAATRPDDSAARALALEKLAQRQEELGKVRAIAGEMQPLLSRLLELTSKPQEFNRVLVRVDALRSEVQRYGNIFRMVIDVSQAAEFRKYAADRRLGSVAEETGETARRRLERDIEFISAFLEGCSFLNDVFPEAIARLERST